MTGPRVEGVPEHGSGPAESYFTATDGLELFRRSWLPADDPRAVVMLLHGLGEHSGRYQRVATALNEAGYAVEALDHRGHGRSDGERVHVASYDELMDDLEVFRALVEERHPGRPLVVLGHSMGGHLALGHALRHQDGLSGLALSAPAVRAGEDISAAQRRMFGLVARFAPRTRLRALDATSISRDPEVVAAYRGDPLVFTGKVTAGLGWALLQEMATFPERYGELRLPILLQHGTADLLADVEGSREIEARAVHADVTAHYYEGLYHEVYNEPEHDRVIADLTTWLDAVVPG